MNYRGKHKKFQTGGPKIDPKVVEQMNKYMSGNNGDIQSRFALDTRVAIANDPVKIKERKKENTKKNYQNLRRVPNLKLYGDKELQMLADKPKDQWPEHVRNSLDNLESDEQRVMMHPDFDRNRPVSEQMELNRDNSLRTRVLRGRNTFMNSSGIPIVSDIAKMVAAPGSSFANLTMDAENQYVKPGVKQGLFNLGIDLLNVAPTETVGLANKSINTVKEVINKSTENGILSNAHKLNPFAFKPNSEMMYRGIGKEGMEDALESGVFRAKQNVAPIMDETGRFDMSKQFQGTYYSPKFNTADQYGAGYIAEVPKDVTNFRLRYKGKGNKTWSQIADENIPIDKGKILKKDWLQGYKQVEVPKTTQNFKSEINWRQWNKEIPENTQLMQEYNTIEQKAKANNTWMKNPDGSKFQGTPEQFIQQNSENFKKAFPDGAVQTYRGSGVHNPELINNKDFKSVFTGDENLARAYGNAYSNKNYQNYFNPNIPTGEELLLKNHPFKDLQAAKLDPKNRSLIRAYSQSEDAGVYNLYSKNTGKNLKIDAKGADWKKLPQQDNLPYLASNDDVAKYIDDNNLDQAFIKNVHDGISGDVLIAAHKKGNYLKSAIGNNGMFDMTNPNIYKALVPATVGAGILSQQEKPKKGFKEGGETMNYRGKKCMECGGNPKMQTAGEMQCPQGYTSDGYGNRIPDEPKKFNMYTVPEQTPDEMAALSKFGDWWKRGRPNQLKTTGNEGTDANPMGRGPVDTGPEKTPEKPKINPFLLMRGVSTGASLIGNMVARKAQNSYEYNQMTALGQMNPIDSDQFQPTYNNMYAEQGGMVNPFSTYSKYGGNLKKIFSQFKQNQEYSNKAQMDMGDGKLDDQGMMEKGGIYDLPNQYGYDIVRKLLRMGRMGHQNYIKGTKPMHGKMQGGGESPPDFSDPRYRGTNPNNYTSKEDRLKARDLLISNIEKDIANGIKYEHANPELIAKGACAFGACTEYEKVGLLKDIYSGNPLFE